MARGSHRAKIKFRVVYYEPEVLQRCDDGAQGHFLIQGFVMPRLNLADLRLTHIAGNVRLDGDTTGRC